MTEVPEDKKDAYRAVMFHQFKDTLEFSSAYVHQLDEIKDSKELDLFFDVAFAIKHVFELWNAQGHIREIDSKEEVLDK